MDAINPLTCAAVLITAFVAAGFVQTAWFAWAGSRALALPLDGGGTFRGRRIFGENKTTRGLVVMVPAAALTLPATASAFMAILPPPSGLWPLSWSGYSALGATAALGFMLGELPNSFVKRQLDIAPGDAAVGRGRLWQLAADRLDSGIGLLLAASLVVPVPLPTWAIVLGIGPLFHWSFSLLMFRLGLKSRAA
jgi:CDP-2,3-bis-(O-geranylgeranyl)-sn-glycerol synthase